MNLRCAKITNQRQNPLRGSAADNTVIHQNHRAVLYVRANRIQFHADAKLTLLLTGKNKGSARIAVFDEGFPKRDAALFCKSNRRSSPGIRDRGYHFRIGRRFPGENLPGLSADIIYRHPVKNRIGAGKVDVLKDTVRRRFRLHQL